MIDITIDNFIDNGDYVTYFIPYNQLDYINIVVMNENNLKQHTQKINEIVRCCMYTDNYNIYNMYKHTISCNYKSSNSVFNDFWINLNNNEAVKNFYINKLINYASKCTNNTFIFCHQNVYENINIIDNENIKYVVFGDDYYSMFTIYDRNVVLYQGYDIEYLGNRITLTIKLNNEKIIYDERYKIIDENNNKFWCISVFKPDTIEFNKINKPNFSMTDDIKTYINYLGMSNLIDNTCNYLINNIDKIKKTAMKCNRLCDKLNNKLLNILRSNLLDDNNNNQIINILKLFIDKKYNYANMRKNIRSMSNILKNTQIINNDINKIESYCNILNNTSHKDDYFDKSCNIYNYLISRSSWFDELQDGYAGGILLCVSSPKSAKLGFSLGDLNISNISDNLLTLEHICEAQNIYQNNNLKYDDGRNKEYAISGNVLGNGNCILPLYINGIHWRMVNLQLNYCLGMMINQNPFDYYGKFYEVYPMVLFKYINQILFSNINDKSVVILIQLIITTNKIFQEKYNCKINKMTIKRCNDLFEKPKNRTENVFDNLYKLLGFTATTLNKRDRNDILKIRSLRRAFLSEIIRRDYKKKYITENIYDLLNVEYLLEKITNNYDINFVMNEYIDNKKIYDYMMFNFVKHKINEQIINNEIDYEFMLHVIDRDSKVYIDFCKSFDHHAKSIICWDIFNEFNDEITIDYLNDIINNKYGNVSDDCIKYFKNKLNSLINKNRQYFDEPINYFKENNIDVEHIKLYIFLQTYFSVGNKYVEENYKKNPYTRANTIDMMLIEGKILKLIKELTICDSYVEKFYDNEKYFRNDVLKYFRKTYDEKINENIIKMLEIQ
jgi:hypothetical protein